jgi:hypothetical protein
MNVADEILQHKYKKVLFIVCFLLNYYAFVFKLRQYKVFASQRPILKLLT